jgi:hypothetical protein
MKLEAMNANENMTTAKPKQIARASRNSAEPFDGRGAMKSFSRPNVPGFKLEPTDIVSLLSGHYFAKLAVCTVEAGRHFRAVSISASVAPLFRAHASAAGSEYLAT